MSPASHTPPRRAKRFRLYAECREDDAADTDRYPALSSEPAILESYLVSTVCLWFLVNCREELGYGIYFFPFLFESFRITYISIILDWFVYTDDVMFTFSCIWHNLYPN